MTYQELKDSLTRCEYTLNCIKDGTLKEKGKKTVKNLELLKESLQTQLKEEEDKGMVVTRDSEEAEKLAKKGVNVNLKTEGPYQTTYIKVAKSDYKKAMAILDDNIDPTYAKMDVVDDDGDNNVIIYFNFRTRDGGEPGEDVEAFIYDAAMDLKAQGVNVTGSSHDIDEARDINDPVLMKLRALKSKIDKKKGISKWQSLRSNQLVVRLKAKRAQVMRDMEQEAEPEGGPIADKYGSELNQIDQAIRKLKGIKNENYDDRNLEEAQDSNNKGYIVARDLIAKLRATTFRKFNDDELEEFRKTIADAFDMSLKEEWSKGRQAQLEIKRLGTMSTHEGWRSVEGRTGQREAARRAQGVEGTWRTAAGQSARGGSFALHILQQPLRLRPAVLVSREPAL